MKAIYEFEQELLKEYDFEPINDGYNIDDLEKADRQELSGMLWILYEAIENWKINEELDNETNGTFGKIANEYLEKAYERLIDRVLSSINDYIISRIESYVE